MKTVKSILALSFLLAGSISFAQPQGGGGGQQGPPPIPNTKQITQMVSDLAENLSLSADQEATVLDLYNEHFDEVKEKTSGSSRPKREEMDALNTTLEKNVKAQLTKDQKSKYEAYLKEQASQRPKR